MSYLKFRADKIFTGTNLLDESHVLITDSKGVIVEIVNEKDAGDNIQVLHGWLTPGFINCHCHLELSHMRGLLPEKIGLIDFVFGVVTQRHFPQEEILDAIDKAEKEMLENGIVAVGDICNNLHTLLQKQKNNLAYYNFIEASGWLPSIASQRFQRSKQYYDVLSELHPSSIVPHAPYSVSDDLWDAITPFFENKVASIHNQETKFEDDLFKTNTGDFVRMYQMMKIDHSFYNATGKSSVQSYFHKLAPAASTILVHNTFTQAEDLEYIGSLRSQKSRPNASPKEVRQGLAGRAKVKSQKAETRNAELTTSNIQPPTSNFQLPTSNLQPPTYFCLCVNANLYIESALPPVELLRKHGANMVLGTDSLASNWSLSIWDEIKTIRQHFPAIPLEEILHWATLNGANALQMEKTLGSFEKGKQPGVLLLENLETVRRLV